MGADFCSGSWWEGTFAAAALGHREELPSSGGGRDAVSNTVLYIISHTGMPGHHALLLPASQPCPSPSFLCTSAFFVTASPYPCPKQEGSILQTPWWAPKAAQDRGLGAATRPCRAGHSQVLHRVSGHAGSGAGRCSLGGAISLFLHWMGLRFSSPYSLP